MAYILGVIEEVESGVHYKGRPTSDYTEVNFPRERGAYAWETRYSRQRGVRRLVGFIAWMPGGAEATDSETWILAWLGPWPTKKSERRIYGKRTKYMRERWGLKEKIGT